jgi:aldehyde dehydrogenase (NAD+)
MGPLISEAHRNRVHALVQEGIAQGARLVTGGKPAPQSSEGWYFLPTVLDIDDKANLVAQREVFGPVITVQGYRSVDEAVAIANDSSYGLGGSHLYGEPRIRASACRTDTHRDSTNQCGVRLRSDSVRSLQAKRARLRAGVAGPSPIPIPQAYLGRI